jgi:hypothetical protein
MLVPLSFVDLSSQDRKAGNGEPDSHVEFPDYSAGLPLFHLRENKRLVDNPGFSIRLFGVFASRFSACTP